MDRKDGQGHHSDSLVQDIKWRILSARISSRKYWMQDLVDPAKALLPLRQWGETHAVHIQKEDVFATHFSCFQFCTLSKQEEKQCLLIDSNPSMIIIKYVLYWTICACTCTYMYMHMMYIYICIYMYCIGQYVHVHVRICICIWCIYIYVYIYIDKHVRICIGILYMIHV